MKRATAAHLNEYVTAVRAMCDRREATWSGSSMRLHWAVPSVPIWIAAEGPRMLDLAGRIADGVIIAGGITPDVVRDAISRVHAGATSAGRDPDDVELWYMLKPCIAVTEEQAWQRFSWTLAATAQHVFAGRLDEKFVPPHLVQPLYNLVARYRSSEHNRPAGSSHNASLVADPALLEFLGRRFMVAGPAVEVRERLAGLIDQGVVNMIFPAVYEDNVAYIEQMQSEVIEPLRWRHQGG